LASISCSFDTAPLNSVINCCTPTTILNILFSRANCLYFEPQRTALHAVPVRAEGPSFPFFLDLPLPSVMSGWCCFSVLPRIAAA
jgi:hypothetical protein